jgi:glycosyltransferase involved in cell wall biosynthesis
VHVPSNPWLKGSALVEPSVRSAEADGVVAYRAASGLPADGVRELYRDADVVLDQFRLGIYGVAACEAMAAGRLVVSDVDAGVRAAVRARTGLDLPVRQAAAEQVGDVLRDAAGAGRADASALARSGPGFVADVHDGRRSAHVLREALGL